MSGKGKTGGGGGGGGGGGAGGAGAKKGGGESALTEYAVMCAMRETIRRELAVVEHAAAGPPSVYEPNPAKLFSLTGKIGHMRTPTEDDYKNLEALRAKLGRTSMAPQARSKDGLADIESHEYGWFHEWYARDEMK